MENKIFLSLLMLFCLGKNSGAVLWPIAEQNSAHALNKTYGDWNGKKVIDTLTMGYHGGVDIPASAGTPVYAASGGVVTSVRYDTLGGYMGFVAIGPDTLGSKAWHYGHIQLKLKASGDSLKRGDPIVIAESLGVVANFPDNNHIHFQPGHPKLTELTGYLNPLDSLSPSPTQVPRINPRNWSTRHPYEIYYYKDKNDDSLANSYGFTYLRDFVDIAVRASVTVQGDTNCGVYSIGYAIEPLKTGGNIPFRKMFEMTGQISCSDSNRYYLTYNKVFSSGFVNYYIVTNCGEAAPVGLSNIQENCWPTKVNKSGTANADSIENAKYPDGYYVTTVKAWSHSGDSAVVKDTVLVDNFPPKVKQTDPPDWAGFVPTKKKKLWCVFSEDMDTTTLTAANIKIQSLKADSFPYPITNISYVKDSFKLYITVDRFRFNDTVQVRLLKGVHDLAGKSIGDAKGDTVAYAWTFVASLLQITDNDSNDVEPDVWHGRMV